MQGDTEGNNDPAEIPEKAKLETSSPDLPPEVAKKPTPEWVVPSEMIPGMNIFPMTFAAAKDEKTYYLAMDTLLYLQT